MRFKLGNKRIVVGFWEYPNPEDKTFIWYENLDGGCGCRFITVLNVLVSIFDKDCNENTI